MNILITGAAGYIGSHIALNLIEQKKNLFFTKSPLAIKADHIQMEKR